MILTAAPGQRTKPCTVTCFEHGQVHNFLNGNTEINGTPVHSTTDMAQAVCGRSPQWPDVLSSPVHVGFVMDEVPMGQVLFPVLRFYFAFSFIYHRRSQWSCGLRRRSTPARLLGLWVRIPPGCLSVSVVCCQVEVSATG